MAPTPHTQSQAGCSGCTTNRTMPATTQATVPMAIGMNAVSGVRHIGATYSSGMSAGARRFITLLVLISLVGAVVLAALGGVVFA